MAKVAAKRRDNLPNDRTSLVGRRAEIDAVKRLGASTRLVTLTGVGGVGKTRLAVAVGRSLVRAFGDGVRLVELGELADPELLSLTVMNAIGLQVRADGSLDELVEGIGEQQLLLILDNCEHLVDACARLTDAVLRACPNVRILATSREALRITGESLFPVPPLTVPADGGADPGDEARYEGVRLLVKRIQAAVPSFTVTEENRRDVIELCRRLDGLPLAIELAAVRVRAMSVRQLLEHHEDRYRILTSGSRAAAPRHQTLRATVDWSYELCTEAERTVWARLAVCSGGIDIEGAEHVCGGAGLDRLDVLDALAGLVDRSVLGHDGTEYRMLETIRYYGLARLRERGEEPAVRLAHRDHYLQQAHTVEAEWFGPKQKELLSHLHREHANLRVALDYCVREAGEQLTGLALATALWPYWISGGQQQEGILWLERLLAANPDPRPERAQALWVLGYVRTAAGRLDAAIAVLDECLELAYDLDEAAALAHATFVRGLVELFSGDLARGTALLVEGVSRERELPGFNPYLTMAMVNLGIAACYGDGVDTAVELLEECRATCAEHGEWWLRSWSLEFLGLARWIRGEWAEAETRLREALQVKRDLEDAVGVAVAVEILGWIAHGLGRDEHAARLLGASQALWEPMGSFLVGFERLKEWSARCTAEVTDALGQAVFDRAHAAGRALSPDEVVAAALGERMQTRGAEQDSGGALGALTPREREVAALVADGLSNQDIATRLVLSKRTAETHVEHILTKLGFTSRTQIAAAVHAVRGDEQ